MLKKVARHIVINPAFNSALKKLFEQDLELKERNSLLELVKAYDPIAIEIQEKCKEFSEQKEQKKDEWFEYLNEQVELPALPESIMHKESLKLSTKDLLFLEHVIEKKS